jgi:hypothetical protein
MNYKIKFDIAQTVYLKTDADQLEIGLLLE